MIGIEMGRGESPLTLGLFVLLRGFYRDVEKLMSFEKNRCYEMNAAFSFLESVFPDQYLLER